MSQDLGFDPMPSARITWDQYYQIAEWFNKNADEVEYGSGHQSKQYDSLMCDFSNILWSYGGDYFENGEQVGKIGTEDPGPSRARPGEGHRGRRVLQEAQRDLAPRQHELGLDRARRGFQGRRAGDGPNWHEFAAGVEASKLGGKVAYERLPTGPSESASMWGGTGPWHQRRALGGRAARGVALPGLGDLARDPALRPQERGRRRHPDPPVRLPEARGPEGAAAPVGHAQHPHYEAVSKAWEPENIGLRPKIEEWNKCDTVIFTELSKMLAGDKSPIRRCRTLRRASTGPTGCSAVSAANASGKDPR
jgi:multiple sugar transport system substrate-binding protein